MVSSGITFVSAIKNADGSFTVTWTDSKGKTHIQTIDFDSDFGGMLFLIAKAVNSGALT
jgi:hypothetical protein